MGIVELFPNEQKAIITSHIYLYGSKASETLRAEMEAETNNMWNAPDTLIKIEGVFYKVIFQVTYFLQPDIAPNTIQNNTNPINNFVRIEEWHPQHISFVDGLGSNTGYYLLTNLYTNSTTAAHEYGHTLGLDHPTDMDYRGKGAPGIMYARGTLVDAAFQYDPNANTGAQGGTMHPIHRKVKAMDIEDLNLQNLNYNNNKAVIGKFTNVWHEMVEQ
jgi:hypothetical protein